ncbi:MAG: PIG-L deacetylase family protein [Thermodesulfobacteriota bacterium]|jgi:LmbE family N-acetylglucosaminyl deacetylase
MDEIDFQEKIVLVVGAHPDDNDFGAGATVAKAARQEAKVIYLIATTGQRGSSDQAMTPERLSGIRKKEQEEAAKFLGVREVHFLDYVDGELIPDIRLKEQVVIYIRRYTPDIVSTMDPSFFYFKDFGFVNHSDHRAIGEATLDACYPLARDLLSFPEHVKTGLQPHKVKELLLHSFVPENANFYMDVTDTFDTKIKALSLHQSQVPDIRQLAKRMRDRAEAAGKLAGCKYAEAFVRLHLPE